tara:strand:+ start:688 stop:951 length:264 start_codon:yes stop_codon:yes gene_type:complete
MKIFLLKTIIIFFSILVLFKLTIGSLYNNLQKNFEEKFSKDSVILFKDKIKNEMNKGLQKNRILEKEDAKLIKAFIDKIKKELNETN